MRKILLFIYTGIILASCSDFLDEKPYDFVSPENLETSPEGVKQMVTGMYSVFYNAQMFRNESWMYLTFCDDEWTNGVEWAMSTYGVGNFKGGWIYNNGGNDPYYVFYRIVRAANAVLEVLPDITFDPADGNIREQFEGESLTLRSLAYFYLVQMYGPIPLHLSTDDPATMERSSVAGVYEQIITDLHRAEKLLYLKSKSPLKRGHITKGAAQLLLAKVYNTMGSGSLTNAYITVPIAINRLKTGEIVTHEMTFAKNAVEGYNFNPAVAYDSAKAVVLRLMTSKEYELERYAETWNPDNFGGHDFVFALESNASITEFTTVFNKFITPVGLSGQGWLHYAKDLFYLYSSLDERGVYGIAHQFRSGNKMNNGFWKLQYFPPEDSIYYQDPGIKDKVLTDTNSNVCYLMKWYLGDASNPYVELSDDATIITNATQNFPILRYAEAYLILAEAENELNGPTDIAYDALDELGSYRYLQVDSLDDYYLMNRTAMTQQELRSYILNERTREFIGEGYRRFDLIRWGIYLEVMNAVDHRAPFRDSQDQIISKKREQKHLLYPVPTIEIDGNTLFGPNNPGW